MQFDLKSNRKYLKTYFTNIQNNINFDSNVESILDVFRLDDNLDQAKEQLYLIYKQSGGNFQKFIKGMVTWK
jgi:hypothetical protein